MTHFPSKSRALDLYQNGISLTAGLLLLSACNSSGISPSSSSLCTTPNGEITYFPPATGSGQGASLLASPFIEGYGYERSGLFSVTEGRTRLTKSLQHHIPRQIHQSQRIAELGEHEEIAISVMLPSDDEAGLHAQVKNIHDPAHPDFRRYLSGHEYRDRFAPKAESVNAVMNHLQQSGLRVFDVATNHHIVHAGGSVAAIKRAFHTQIHWYQAASGRQFIAPLYEPSVPEDLNIHSVFGLETQSQAKHYARYLGGSARAATMGQTAHLNHGTGPLNGYAPSDITTAYNFPGGPTGSGQQVALFELDGYTLSDITTYESHYNLPHTPIKNILIDCATGQDMTGGGEPTLDLQVLAAVAPGLSSILFYEGPNSSQGLIDTYNRIASDNTASIVSTSWGLPESDLSANQASAQHTIFAQMAAQGQTIFAAAGDNGANDNGSSLSTDNPASDPYVTGVGGLSLTVTAGTEAYSSETTWNDLSAQGGGAGGGISVTWPIPSWQSPVISGSAMSSSTMRNVPDVSLNADENHGYSIYYQGSFAVAGGTSAAAPIWAGFMALVNEQRANLHYSPIGFLNPTLYALNFSGGALTAAYSSDYHDIDDGSSNGHFLAVTGYDNATGWGSFNAGNLYNSLSSVH